MKGLENSNTKFEVKCEPKIHYLEKKQIIIECILNSVQNL